MECQLFLIIEGNYIDCLKFIYTKQGLFFKTKTKLALIPVMENSFECLIELISD